MSNSKSTGIAYSDPEFESITVTGNAKLGDAGADLVGFHGKQVAQASFIATVTGSASAQASAAAVNAILELLAAKGLMASS